MSTEIEQRVVEMQFDNKQFERNVSTTMSSLDKLKQSLNLTGAAKGLESVGASAKGINLSGLTSAAETVGLKFNAMWTIADQALRNITNSAYYAGKRIVDSLTIEPVKMGFSEYETQINAVQTILANTKSKGTTIDNVNTALDELNTYADKTIYNFTEMTRNIGTFTAAGVDLDKSVTSIKGIANLAAVSGSTSQQASTAMYQLSQALAAGKVQLMDWNSVVNAGMGGEVFQEALKRTAKNMGTNVDAMIKKYGSFRESLTKGEWLTADVLTETLTQLSGAYTEADLLAKGYTKEQAADILELAATAESAATDVKTFTQLWDTLKESAQSGWTQTWEILIGDFEEAKALFSQVSKVIGEMIGDSAEARNNLLQGWKDAGGRADLIEGIKSAFEGVMNIIKPIKEAFRNIFPPTTVDQLANITSGFKNLMESFAEFTSAHGDQIRTTFEGIFSVIDIGWTFVKKLAGGIGDLFGRFTGLGGSVLDATAGIGGWLTGLRDTVKETDIFGTAIDKVVGFLGEVIDKLKSFGGSIKKAFQAPGVQGFFDIMSSIWGVIVKIGSKVGEIFAPLGQAVSNLFGNANFADIMNDGIFAAVLVGIYKFVDNLNGPLESIKDMFDGLAGEDGIFGGIKETLDSVRGCFEAYQNSLQAETIKKIATAIAILAAAIFVISSIDGDKLDHSLGAVSVLFAELIASLALFNKINAGGKGLLKGTAAITGLATALLILSGAMKIMSTMSWNEIAVGITGTVVGLGALVGAVNLLPEKNVKKSAKAISKLATTLVILAAGMKIMASMSWQEMAVAMAGVVGGLGALVAAVNLLPKDAAVRSLGMVGLATSMVILGGALKLMGTMSWAEIGRGLTAMAGSMAAIVIAMNLMPKDMALRSLGMVGLATAMVILGTALKSMGGMSWEEIGRGLAVMGGALAELAIALNLMNGTLAGSAALIIAAGALAIIAPVMKTLGGLSWESIGKGLVALAGAFAVIGIAGALLTPLVPTLLGLAGAMALFGVATLGVGIGIAALAAGFTALATAGTAGATALVAAVSAIVVGLVDLIPTIVSSLGDAIVALCDVLIEVAPKLADTLLIVVSEVLASLATYTPQIVDSLLQFLIGVLDALAANLPQLIASAMNVIGAFFQGIVDALSGLDTSSLLKGIAGVGLLTGLMFALSALTPMIPSAMAGVLGMGVLIAELALVLAAVGALAQIPGLSWLIGEGGDLLQQIGTAIGQFVGGIVGGIAEGATSTLPQVGQNLSDFMTNLQPFITGMQGIDSTMLDNAKTLASAILTLTAADLLSGIASFFKGGTSLADFGTEIAAFGTAMKDYSAEVAGIDTDAISASVAAGSTLVKMAKDIPGDGLFGTDGIDDFGKNIVKFGECMKKYGAEVVDIDSAAITSSVSAAKGLVSVAKQIPDDGAFGTDGIDNFGKNIVSFAKSLKKYSDNIAEVSLSSISKSTTAVRSLINAINSMVGMDSSGVEGFKKAVNDLAKVNFNGVVQAFSTSAAKLTNVGKDMFNSIILGIKSTKVEFANATKAIISTSLTTIDGLSGKFEASGVKTIGKFLDGILTGRVKASQAFTTVLATALSTINTYRSSFYSAGAYLVSGFANGILANQYKAIIQARAMAAAAANAARRELDEHSPSRVGYEIGDFFGIAFVNAIADNTKRAYAASAEMANSAKSGLKNAFDKVGRIISGEVDVNPTIKPVLDLTNVRSGANAINGMLGLQPSVGVLAHVGAVSSMMSQRNQTASNDDVVYAINKLQKALGNVGNTYNSIGNVTYDDGSNIAEAIKVLTGAIIRDGRS
jgi:tape measure domain-containing protein